jgi:hypothetical protein
MEDAPLKVLYAVVFALSALAAPVQAFDSWPVAAYDLDDCSWEVTEQSTLPAPTVAAEPPINDLAATGGAAITAPDDRENVALGIVPPSDATQLLPSPTPTPIAANEPIVANETHAIDETDDIIIKAMIDAEDILGEAVETGGVSQMVPPQLVASEQTQLAEVVEEADDIFE